MHNSLCQSTSVVDFNTPTPLLILLFLTEELTLTMSRERKTQMHVHIKHYIRPTELFDFQCIQRKNLQCLTLSLSHIQVDWKNNDNSFFDLSYFILVFTNELWITHKHVCSQITLTKHYLCCLSVNHSGDQARTWTDAEKDKHQNNATNWQLIGEVSGPNAHKTVYRANPDHAVP